MSGDSDAQAMANRALDDIIKVIDPVIDPLPEARVAVAIAIPDAATNTMKFEWVTANFDAFDLLCLAADALENIPDEEKATLRGHEARVERLRVDSEAIITDIVKGSYN